MRNDNGKNPDTQLPVQVEAVNQFRKLIEAYFEMNSLSDLNKTLTEMLNAATQHNPCSRKHSPIAIANTLYEVNNIINLASKTKPLANKKTFKQYAKNLGYRLQAVKHFNIADLSELLYYGLNTYIIQDNAFEGATLNFSTQIANAYKMIYDWLEDCHEWYHAIKEE